MSLWDFLCSGPIGGFIDSVVKNVVCDDVIPERGSIVRCDLCCGMADHTGVYLGNGQIAELDSDGSISVVSPSEFLNRGSARTGVRIYVACEANGFETVPLIYPKAAERAEAKLGHARNYHLLFDNCHQFTSGCISGDFENSANALWMLENTISQKMNNSAPVAWRIWEQ